MRIVAFLVIALLAYIQHFRCTLVLCKSLRARRLPRRVELRGRVTSLERQYQGKLTKKRCECMFTIIIVSPTSGKSWRIHLYER